VLRRLKKGVNMPKYDGLRKTKRDNKIRAFAEKHPDWSQQEIADKFKLARSNISRILAPKKKPSTSTEP